MSRDDDRPPSFASPPCYMHEVDPAYMGLADPTDPLQRADVMRWRKAERQRRIAERLEIDSATRRRNSERIVHRLLEEIGEVRSLVVSVYWPFLGEPDLRTLIEHVTAQGGRCALPVVVERGQPLIFRSWAPGEKLERGVWNIPVPSCREEIVPDLVIAPVIAFDPLCYRLGYGGGFYDRTLAALPRKPRVLGVGFAQAAIPTIYPQPHDIPMDLVVTEVAGISPTPELERGCK
jgi:5-formyltetrahydrofolate cyclo-ligase